MSKSEVRKSTRHSNWLPIGVIGIILSIILFIGGNYAYNYVEWLDAWHYTPFGMVRDSRMPYRDYAFPMYIIGLCLFVVGIVSIWHDYTIRKKEKKVFSRKRTSI